MARNVEIKARIDSIDVLRERAAALADSGPELIVQDDSFFTCNNGRLKLRAFPDGNGELIFYRRADGVDAKESFYVRSPTASPDTLREALRLAWGITGRVRKRRWLYLVGRTRIHVDEVEGLGPHIELEVVLDDAESAEAGSVIAQALMAQLGVAPSQWLAGAYVDLLAKRG